MLTCYLKIRKIYLYVNTLKENYFVLFHALQKCLHCKKDTKGVIRSGKIEGQTILWPKDYNISSLTWRKTKLWSIVVQNLKCNIYHLLGTIPVLYYCFFFVYVCESDVQHFVLYTLTFWVPCCDVGFDFRKKRFSVHHYLQLFVGGFMSYLHYLCLLCIMVSNTYWLYEEHCGCLIRGRNCLPFASGWAHPPCFWWGSMLFMFLVFCVVFFVLFVFVLCTQCCQFFWIVHSWLLLRFSQIWFNDNKSLKILKRSSEAVKRRTYTIIQWLGKKRCKRRRMVHKTQTTSYIYSNNIGLMFL